MQHNKTVAAVLAIVTILACARMRANASRTLGRQAAEPDVIRRLVGDSMAKKRKRFVTTFTEYHETEIIGEGGSGRVYKVLDGDGKDFALKLLASDRATMEKRARFRN